MPKFVILSHESLHEYGTIGDSSNKLECFLNIFPTFSMKFEKRLHLVSLLHNVKCVRVQGATSLYTRTLRVEIFNCHASVPALRVAHFPFVF